MLDWGRGRIRVVCVGVGGGRGGGPLVREDMGMVGAGEVVRKRAEGVRRGRRSSERRSSMGERNVIGRVEVEFFAVGMDSAGGFGGLMEMLYQARFMVTSFVMIEDLMTSDF